MIAAVSLPLRGILRSFSVSVLVSARSVIRRTSAQFLAWADLANLQLIQVFAVWCCIALLCSTLF